MLLKRFPFAVFCILSFPLAGMVMSQTAVLNGQIVGAIIAAPQENSETKEEAASKQTPLESGRVGSFQITRKHLPSAIYNRAASCFGAKSAPSEAAVVSGKTDVVYEVSVGDSYDPEKPAGVFVFISASDNGRAPKGFAEVLAERNIIFIGANNSGNEVSPPWRVAMAANAVRVLKRSLQS